MRRSAGASEVPTQLSALLLFEANVALQELKKIGPTTRAVFLSGPSHFQEPRQMSQTALIYFIFPSNTKQNEFTRGFNFKLG
jgi:hypothetical protein